MTIKETKLKGCFLLEPDVFYDARGHFMESFNSKRFNEAIGSSISFVQDNQSFSKKGVIRALHFQIGEHAQAKLVRVLSGKVLDVAVDLRRNSPTFGEHVSYELSQENRKQLFIPKGFAHGFASLSEGAELLYKCDNFYHKEAERGIIYNDSELGIDWGLSAEMVILSEKDRSLPFLKDLDL